MCVCIYSTCVALVCLQVLQSIGNLSPEMDAKEAYMHPMSAILANGVERVKEYIQDLVQLDQRHGTYLLLYIVTNLFIAWEYNHDIL